MRTGLNPGAAYIWMEISHFRWLKTIWHGMTAKKTRAKTGRNVSTVTRGAMTNTRLNKNWYMGGAMLHYRPDLGRMRAGAKDAWRFKPLRGPEMRGGRDDDPAKYSPIEINLETRWRRMILARRHGCVGHRSKKTPTNIGPGVGRKIVMRGLDALLGQKPFLAW